MTAEPSLSAPSTRPRTYETQPFAPEILREYDIRGQIEKNLNENNAYTLGRAFGTMIRRNGGRTVCTGYDGRHSSPALLTALHKGLMESGINIRAAGLGPTPLLYFAVKHTQSDAGIMITGSHNPADYNGFKMTLQTGPVFGQKIQDLGQIAAQGDFEKGGFENGEGTLEPLDDIENAYITRLMQDYTAGAKEFTIAWDAGNGAAGNALKHLADRLPGTHHLLYETIDGDFPNHHPDPTVDKNLTDLIKAVKHNNCDLGIAFDGDGDRIGVVDHTGQILRCDVLIALYARAVLKTHPGAPIIGDIKCSKVMFEEIEKLGGTPVMWKTGHSLIKDKMAEMSAPLAGELSGHIFFADHYYGFDDALYCAIRLLNILAETGQSLHDLAKPFERLHATPEVRFEVRQDEKFDLVPRVLAHLQSLNDPDITINDIDGVRVGTPDGWWLLRPSNTQDVLVARAEGHNAQALERLKTHLSEHVQKIGYHIDFEE